MKKRISILLALVMLSALAVPTVAFAAPAFVNIAVLPVTPNTGSAQAPNKPKVGDTVTLTAAPADGYYFSRWLENNVEISTNHILQFVASTDRVLHAEFLPVGQIALSASSSSYNSNKLSWTAASGATSYEVLFATSSSGNYTKLTQTTALSYKHTGLLTGQRYYYRVRAVNTLGNKSTYGPFSARNATPTLAAPKTAKVVKAGSGKAKVSWGAVAGRTKYELHRAMSASGKYTKIAETTTAYKVVSSLKKGKTYFFKARAYRLVGTKKVYGAFSAKVKIKL